MTPDEIARLLIHSENLTEISRTGYVLAGVSDSEKVSSHCFGVTFITLLLSSLIDGIDQNKSLKMSIIHDLPESVIGDLTPETSEYIDKKAIEVEVIKKLFRNQNDLKELFYEYQNNKSKESKLVHDADKLQMMIRVNRYKCQNKGDMTRFNGTRFFFQISNDILSSFIKLDQNERTK